MKCAICESVSMGGPPVGETHRAGGYPSGHLRGPGRAQEVMSDDATVQGAGKRQKSGRLTARGDA